MRLSVLSIFSLSLATFSSASPTPAGSSLAPRACTTVLPDVMINWNKADPNHVPLAASAGIIDLERTGGPGSNTVRTAFSFNSLPAKSTGCMLQFQYPTVWRADLFAVGANNFDIYGSSVPIKYGTSWNTQPAKADFRGSANVANWVTTSPFKTIVWSTASCGPGLSFILELSDWQQAGNIQMENDGFGLPISIETGFALIYDC